MFWSGGYFTGAGRAIGREIGAPIDGVVADGPGYAGHVSDASTGLSYMQQRYYDPQIGRFLSVDPVTANSSSDTRLFGRYQYAFNNPYRFTDPDGGCPVCVPFVTGLMIYLTSGPANAPAVGEKTSDMPEGEQIASAIPGGGPTARTIRFGVKQIDSQLRRPYIRKDVRQEVEGGLLVPRMAGQSIRIRTDQLMANQTLGTRPAMSIAPKPQAQNQKD
ncbi:MAG: RHS repeat-associated core domain-containing protein [Burkholderiales bacterium]